MAELPGEKQQGRKLTFLELIEKVLKETKSQMSPGEIWQYVTSKGYSEQLGTKGKTPWISVSSVLSVDTRLNPDSIFERVGVRPIRYRLRTPVFASETLPRPPPPGPTKPAYLEADLHPVLAQFAYERLTTRVKTIRHQKSKKSEFGEWLYPDLVGFNYPVDDWEELALDLSAISGSRPVTFCSFEVKRELDFSNLRESFFQAVSNSSWAHRGYLAAAEISLDEDFRDELRRLCAAHGIGVIHLDRETPSESEVLIEPRLRPDLDWETVNKLCSLNTDFKEFIRNVKVDVEGKKIHESEYDRIEPPL